MNPEGGTILSMSAMRLMTAVAPSVADGYAQSTIGLINFMLSLVGQEYERGAEIRVAENADIRAVFSELGPKVRDKALKEKLDAAAKAKDASLRISVLNASNYELRRLLTELHAHVEGQDGADARAAETRIWKLLKAIADRRVVSLAPAQ